MIRSVANLTRQDGKGFFELASKFSINTETVALPLNQANEALESLRRGRIHGAVVLTMNQQ